MQAPYWSQGMNRYAYVFNDPLNATDPSGFISMSDVVGGFVAVGHIGGFVVPALANGSLPTLGAVGVPTVGSSALTVPGLLQGQPGSGPTVLQSGPDLRLAQNMGDPSTGTDIPGNAPDTVARPDVPPQLGPSDAAVVALPRTLVAIAEAAEAWLARAGAALRAIGPALSLPEAVMVSPILFPSDSVQMVPAPKTLDAFPDATRAKPKTPVQGGQGLRSRWRIPGGDILEWDSRHGTLERYNPKGKHKGEFDPKTGRRVKPPNPKYRVEP